MLASAPDVNLPSSLPSSWPHLNEQIVINRIGALKANPNLIDQGALGLCGEAAFFHHVLQRCPIRFGAMAKLLFMDGTGWLNDLKIHPDSDLRNADYPVIVTDRLFEIQEALDEEPARHLSEIPDQADWMILSSLCDSENLVFDFEGGPHEPIAEGTYFWQMKKWYLKSKLYKTVSAYTNDDITAIQSEILKTNGNHITLNIKTKMISESYGFFERHFITLESPLIIDPINDSVSFTYWTWGRNYFDDSRGDLTIEKFCDYYLGAIVAEF